ncbi:MAG: hypothetical protein A3D31_03200 [Candidatus Fluviicola riflensis]|nr:MAG: hypothetical protein CHH17_11840 [Candidatus Fluviicola riflensis]OGS78992.1 MAG: hypothetical protein A3D31_03200 [Candidatus Fluviicola riflensis]OGS86014.1 MAG: hypothetical protein A3E30_10685 [Fluviicola sp. RIFCSPHIGHO2_12_FULL_43_24]OGS86423.1 MAG: hypothetical protein A2724_02655 [Fluviicola sp. RIFCSPHIGHO2_01_FULL_43_53]
MVAKNIELDKIKALLIILVFSFLSCTSNTKTSRNSTVETVSPPVFNPNNYDEIGFACGAGGKGTLLVDEFTTFIMDKNYEPLRAKLYSSKPGEVYLATISCEKLAEEGMIKLRESELSQMKKNRNKTDTIAICSGCTRSEYFTVKQLLNDTTNNMRIEAGWWFDEILGKNIIEE